MKVSNLAAPRFTAAITPCFLLRVGGISTNLLDDLRFHDTVDWQHRVLLQQEWLTSKKQPLADHLHAMVDTYKEHQMLRRKLINLRRDIFNLRLSADTSAARQVANLLSVQERAPLEGWLDAWDGLQHLLSEGAVLFARELGTKRARLKTLYQLADFRKGVLLSSASLDGAIDRYLGSDNVQLNREARTVERSLYEYLVRMAWKTSPFSTFTPVCVGYFSQKQSSQSHGITLELPEIAKRSSTRLNVLVLARLGAQLQGAVSVRHTLPVRLTSGWRVHGGYIHYVRRRPTLDSSETAALSMLDVMHENTLKLPMGRLLDAVVTLLQEGQELPVDIIVERICASGEYAGTQHTVEQFLQHLLRLGLLVVPGLHMDIHHDRPLSGYRQRVFTIASDQLQQTLSLIERRVDDYAAATLEERRSILHQIQHHLSHIGPDESSAPLVLPRTLLYEDTTLQPQRLDVDRAVWAHLLDEVAQLQTILPLFDPSLFQKLTLRGYFLARYGVGARCDDVLSFADGFNQDLIEVAQGELGYTYRFDQEGRLLRSDNLFALEQVEQLQDGRQAVADIVNGAYRQLREGAEELILDETFLTQVSTHVLPTQEVQSHTFFAHYCGFDDEALLVINQVFSGLTLMFSRFAYCFEEKAELISILRATLQKIQPPNAVFAEMKGGYDATNLNLHPVVTAYELICPGEFSTRPVEEQLPLDDLYVQDNQDQGRLCLYSRRLQKEVIPLYLGFLMPLLLPEIQKVLLTFSCAAFCQLDLWQGVRLESSAAGVISYPRLRYKHLVLQRAGWQLACTRFPCREPLQSDADYFLAMTRWRTELHLPSRVFLTPDRMGAAIEQSESAQREQADAVMPMKPLYVDFENAFSVLLLESTVRKMKGQLLLCEVLPDQDRLWFKKDGQSYVSEFVFEMNQYKEVQRG